MQLIQGNAVSLTGLSLRQTQVNAVSLARLSLRDTQVNSVSLVGLSLRETQVNARNAALPWISRKLNPLSDIALP